VWDRNVSYYLMSGADPRFRSSCAGSMLIWEAVKYAATVSECFDFEGSMIESVEHFFRGFGARQVPFFQLSKSSRRMRFLMAARQLYFAAVNRAPDPFG
jgi:hypothetical protein